MDRHGSLRWAVLVSLAFPAAALAQSPGVLYTWNGTGNVQGWFKNFGTNTVTLSNATAGQLTVTETGTAGTGVALSDDFNAIAEGTPSIGGLDLTGLNTIEIDMGHNGAAPVSVQFFVQASPAATFVALGPDQNVMPGVDTYALPLASLTPEQHVYIRTIGVNIRDHLAEGNLTWTIEEVRSKGNPLSIRGFATHRPGSSDSGLQGAIVNFDNTAVQGNDGNQNQTGLSHNTGPDPPGNDGTLRWTDLATGNGAAVSYANGTAFQGNTFNERPADMSNYRFITLVMSATNTTGSVGSVDVQYFLQTGASFSYQAAGPNQTLPADGQLYRLVFPIEDITDRAYVMQHGVNLGEHAGGDVIIDIDVIRASTDEPGASVPVLSTAGWVVLTLASIACGAGLLRRKRLAIT
jgi:hypothetical protein